LFAQGFWSARSTRIVWPHLIFQKQESRSTKEMTFSPNLQKKKKVPDTFISGHGYDTEAQ